MVTWLTGTVSSNASSRPVLASFRQRRYSLKASSLASVGVETVKLPPRSPNLNAYAERFVRSVKESCLDRLILVGEGSLRKSVREFVEHYHFERAWTTG